MRVLLFLAGVIVVLLIIGSLVPGGDGDPPSATPRTSRPAPTPDVRQQLYNGFLQVAREYARDTPERSCDPDYQQTIADLIPAATEAQEVLVQLAMGDACREVGEWAGTPYSPYHAKSPR